MSWQTLLSAGMLIAALGILALGARRRHSRAAQGAALVVALASAAWLASSRRAGESSEVFSDRPLAFPAAGYVSSTTCQACHPDAYATWHASYHRTMTQVATPESVRAPADGRAVSIGGRSLRLEGGDGALEVEMTDPEADGPLAERRLVKRPLALVTGSHHMQVYWYPSGQSRFLGMLPFVYLLGEERWVPRPAIFIGPPTDVIDAEIGRWNTTCFQCHTTQVRPGYKSDSEAETAVTEFGIACEECHGPAEAHVRANRDPVRRYEQHLSDAPEPSIVNPRRLSHERTSEVCGQCHGISMYRTREELERFRTEGFEYVPGDDLNATRHLVRGKGGPVPPLVRETLREHPAYLESHFWSDGMLRVSGREYNGLLETPCFQRGTLTCLSCHAMHQPPGDPRPVAEWANDQLGVGMDGNEACLQCHSGFRTRLEEHTHHAAASEGSRCMNCHMPYTTWGLLKAIRSHTVDSPSVAASLATGRPDACNQCHLDRPLGWAAQELESWYGIAAPELTQEQQTVSAAVLWTLTGDAGQRALMAWSMGWEPARSASGRDWLAPYLLQLLLDDPYPAVRLVATRSLRSLPGFEGLRYDPNGPEPERVLAARQAYRTWSRTRREPPAAPEATLVDAAGIRGKELEALWQRRNDRVVELRE
jgi:hypothetical protein